MAALGSLVSLYWLVFAPFLMVLADAIRHLTADFHLNGSYHKKAAPSSLSI